MAKYGITVRRLLPIGLAVIFAAGMLAIVPGIAFALTGDGYNGTSPEVATGLNGKTCASDAVTLQTTKIHSFTATVGTIDLRYSQNCRTEWARVKNYKHSGWQATGIVRDDRVSYDYTMGTCRTFCIDNVGENVSSYGYQVYVGTYAAHAIGYICGPDSSCSATDSYSDVAVASTTPPSCGSVMHCYSRAFEASEVFSAAQNVGYTGGQYERINQPAVSDGSDGWAVVETMWIRLGSGMKEWLELGTRYERMYPEGRYYWGHGSGGDITPGGTMIDGTPWLDGKTTFALYQIGCVWHIEINGVDKDTYESCLKGSAILVGLEVAQEGTKVPALDITGLKYKHSSAGVWKAWSGRDSTDVTPFSTLCGQWFNETWWRASQNVGAC